MNEVIRYEAVHLRYEESDIRYGEGCEVQVVTAAAYNELYKQNMSLVATFARLTDFLGIDVEAAKSAPGKPSDVFIEAIVRYANNQTNAAFIAAAGEAKKL